MRNSKVAARLVPVAKPVRKPMDVEGLRALRGSMPYQAESAVDLVRKMRDDGY